MELKFTFNKSYKFDASGNSKSDSINITQIGSLDSAGAEYDYRYLGETWGSLVYSECPIMVPVTMI